MYHEFKEEVNQLIEANQIKVKKINRRKSIRLLIKAKKNIKKRINNNRANLSKEEKYLLIARMKMIEEAIKEEEHLQISTKN